jgi:insertion element IS1 protein InsB
VQRGAQGGILRAYQERASLRGVCRVFGVSRPTVAARLKKLRRLPKAADGLAEAQPGDALELGEACPERSRRVCGYVRKRRNKAWTGTALCRRTRQVVAYADGDRSEATCRVLWGGIPEAYRRCRTFGDFREAHASVFSEAQRLSVGKETGEAAHRERWHNALRQRVGRTVRKTLSFSKDATWHGGVIHWFVVTYNSSVSVNI